MAHNEIRFTVKLPPISKKNSIQIFRPNGMNRPIIAPSKQYKEYEKSAMWFMPKLQHPINYPVNIKCIFYMPTRRKCDLTNMLEAIDDVMVKARLIEDDNFSIVVGHDGSRILYDKENPRTEVIITEINEV